MKLWGPSETRRKNSRVRDFMQQLALSQGRGFDDFHSLYAWSIEAPQDFWRETWTFCEIISSASGEIVLENETAMPGARWFPEARLNFAENLLRFRDQQPALVFWGEEQKRQTISYSDLYEAVAKLAHSLKALGLRPGDRVAACVPNMPEAIIAMLASASLGAVWSSCSPDFGASGILDRFGQIEPKILFVCEGYFFKGQAIDVLKKAREVADQISSLKAVVIIPYTTTNPEASQFALGSSGVVTTFPRLLENSAASIDFIQLPFDHPLYIMFSSGTTGQPKCIVHSAGGTLIEHFKELTFHTDLKRSDRIFYQTTCGWMMWNWLVSSLGLGATLILYDGAPFHRSGRILFDLAEQEQVTIFGTNAKFISACEKEGLKPRETHALSNLHTILSTGSPLAPESFDYVYRDFKKDVCLSSISGGTDILGCFALGSPLLPVYRGELQTRSLGLQVEVYDESGTSVQGEKGELVCTKPFPSMPIGFWNDPQGEKYKAAYFSKFPNVWHHGDYVELTEHQGLIFHGRSDAVLNPGGIRIGTSEIYRQVEKIPEVLESIAIGQDWDGDVRIVLFVRIAPEISFNEELQTKIRSVIRQNTSPFHVPKKIIAVTDIPRTRSGKIVELAVRDMVHGRAVKNLEALANPEALQMFKDIPELQCE